MEQIRKTVWASMMDCCILTYMYVHLDVLCRIHLVNLTLQCVVAPIILGKCISLSIIKVTGQTFVDQLLLIHEYAQQKQCAWPNIEAL